MSYLRRCCPPSASWLIDLLVMVRPGRLIYVAAYLAAFLAAVRVGWGSVFALVSIIVLIFRYWGRGWRLGFRGRGAGVLGAGGRGLWGARPGFRGWRPGFRGAGARGLGV